MTKLLSEQPIKLRFRIRLPCPRPGKSVWGDYYFARSLAEALERRGHRVIMQYKQKKGWRTRLDKWQAPFRSDIDIVLRGKYAYARERSRHSIMWLISNSTSVSDSEIAEMDHVFVASEHHTDVLTRRGHRNVAYLPQCTDRYLFFPGRYTRSVGQREALFVGNRRDFERFAVVHALKAGIPLSVWGERWKDILPEVMIKGKHVDNSALGALYASADVVFNDHTPDMLANGFTSNRVFDVLACGAPLVSDSSAGLDPKLREMVYLFDDYDSFVSAYQAATHEEPEVKRRRLEIAEIVRQEHSFDNRAAEIEAAALRLREKRQSRQRCRRPRTRPPSSNVSIR